MTNWSTIIQAPRAPKPTTMSPRRAFLLRTAKASNITAKKLRKNLESLVSTGPPVAIGYMPT